MARDFSEPFLVKGEVCKRKKGKDGLILNFLTNSVVYIDIAIDYTIGGFLTILQPLLLLRGFPEKVYRNVEVSWLQQTES